MPKEEKPIEFQAIRPFGPTIIRGKLSDSLVKLLDDKSSKMLKDKDYSTPVDKQYMRMKYATDDCNSDFFEGFEVYSVKESTHQ